MAAFYGDIDEARKLISHGEEIDAKIQDNDYRGHNVTPLYFEVKQGHVDIAKILIENGASVAVRSRDENLLDLACNTDKPEMIELILNKDLDINQLGEHGLTPLAKSLKNDKCRSVEFLLKLGADYKKPSHSKSPLQFAMGKEGTKRADILLKHIEFKEGKSGLIECLRFQDDQGNTGITRSLYQQESRCSQVGT